MKPQQVLPEISPSRIKIWLFIVGTFLLVLNASYIPLNITKTTLKIQELEDEIETFDERLDQLMAQWRDFQMLDFEARTIASALRIIEVLKQTDSEQYKNLTESYRNAMKSALSLLILDSNKRKDKLAEIEATQTKDLDQAKIAYVLEFNSWFNTKADSRLLKIKEKRQLDGFFVFWTSFFSIIQGIGLVLIFISDLSNKEYLRIAWHDIKALPKLVQRLLFDKR